MLPAPRRMDWVTAWQAALPVYSLAIVLHAIFSMFALPIWAIFYLYARKVLDGARAAEDPWRGGGSPRPYLSSWVLAILSHYSGFAVAGLGGPLGAEVAGTFAGVAALLLAALFMAGAAPPGVRDARAWTRFAVAAEAVASLAAPGLYVRLLPTTGTGAVIVYFGQIALAGLSAAAFGAARRHGARAAPGHARKVPRG